MYMDIEMPRIIFTAVFLGLATTSVFAATDSSTSMGGSAKLEL
jgi:hypothetical protein